MDTQEFHTCHKHESMGANLEMAAKRECSISMLWNWYTVDSCFLFSQWHVHSKVGFAFSVIGIFMIVCAVEALRRAARDYDRKIVTQRTGKIGRNSVGTRSEIRPTWYQQLVRGLFYGVQFSIAYLVMLIAMSYNGFVLFAIFMGGTIGYTLFSADNLSVGIGSDAVHSGSCC
ncbi:Copper Transporter integral membrane protein that functions in high affinity copper transport [Ceratobasidium sp. 428]|nr:Copper Transporter integral membrane protein that functions in high affinity copper transport [Ceratobasidium sp. 428]